MKVYDVKTGGGIDVDPGDVQSKILSGQYNLDPNSQVMMNDGAGNIVPMSGVEASKHLSDPQTPKYIMPDQAIKSDNQTKQYGNVGQQVLGAAEDISNVASLGLSDAIVKKGVELVKGKDAAEQYANDREMRREENPLLHVGATVAGVVTDPYGVFGLAGKASKAITAPFFGEASSTLGKIIQKAATGGVEGTILNSANYTLPKLIDDNPISADALLDHSLRGARDFSLLYGVVGSGEAALKSIGEAKNAGLGYLNKFVQSDGESLGADIQSRPVTIDNLKRSETDFGKKATSFDLSENKEGDTSIIHKDGIKTTALSPEMVGGKGADFSNPQGLQEIGDRNNIKDFDVKYQNLKLPDEASRDFLTRMKQNQIKVDWLNKNEMVLNPEEANVLDQHRQVIDMLKKHPNDALLKQHLMVIDEGIDLITKNLQSKPQINRIELNRSLVKQELEQMSYEVKNATRTQGLTVNSDGEVNGRYDDNLYPDYYREVGAQNPEDFEKILRSGKGKRYERIVELAKGRLENGYESPQSGPVHPNPDYFTGTAEEGVASRIPITETNILNGKLKNAESGVSDYINSLDHVKSNGQLHIFNPNEVKGELTQVTSKTPFSDEANQVNEELGVKNSFLNKQRRETYNNVTKYMKDELYPKSAEDLAPGEHIIDYIAKKNSENLIESKANLDNVVEKAINQLEVAGKGTKMTNLNIADYIENNIMDQYRDIHTGNAKPGAVKEFNGLQNYANEFKQSGFTYNKYGAKEYHPVDMGELRQIRIRTDAKADWENKDASGIVLEAARQLRDHIESHIIDSIDKVNPGTTKEYLAAKKASHYALQADAIIGAATVKGAKVAAKGSNAMTAYFGSKLGGSIAGKPGAMLGFYLGGKIGSGSEAVGMLNQYNATVKNFINQQLAESLTKYNSQVVRAANGLINNQTPKYNSIRGTETYNYKDIKKDKELLQKSQGEQVSRTNDFIERNKGLFGVAPETANQMLLTTNKANQFLTSKIPINPYQGMPWREDKWEPNQLEIDKYFRYKEAVTKPGTILKQFQDGYVTPEAVEVLNQVYPKTKEELGTQVMHKISPNISQEKRLMIYKVFGLPMDNYSHGRLFGEMQNTAASMIVAESQDAQQVNTSKMQNPMEQLTNGSNSIRQQN